MQNSKFQFLNPYLTEVHFNINQDFHADDKELEMQNEFQVQIKKSKYENRANVGLILEMNKENNEAPFKLRIQVASDFKWTDLDDETVESMLKLNAPALLLGYMRPIVASITNSSCFPVYNLPFVNFKA